MRYTNYHKSDWSKFKPGNKQTTTKFVIGWCIYTTAHYDTNYIKYKQPYFGYVGYELGIN